ncbi:Tad domain-containing protein [Thiohalomonas denitrificans]|nr:Tad domain-containing protein [Thiohalomonas denitrificans]
MRSQQRGIIFPLMAISILVLLGIAGLVVDLGQAYARKSELQNVLDAAALSGAKVLNETGSAEQGQNAAIATYGSNLPALFLTGDAVPLVELSDTYQPFVPGGTEPQYIRVRVDEIQFATWFAHVLPGIGEMLTVGGSALAGPSPPLSLVCDLVPVMVCGDPDAEHFGYSAGAEEEVLKSGAGSDGSEVGPGNFQLLSLGCGTGADCVRGGLAGEYEACTTEGDTMTTEPGNTVGPVAQGLNTRFGIYNGPMRPEDASPDTVTHYDFSSDENFFWHADYEERQADGPHDYPEPEGVPNRRMLAVPIGDCSTTTNGRGEVDVLGIGCFFLTRPAEQGGDQEIYGQFVDECPASGSAAEEPVTDPTSGSTLHKVVLYKDPDSVDS